MVTKKRVISFLLVFSMLATVFSSYTVAAENNRNEDRIQSIIEELRTASSQKEIDALLTEYHEITDRARASSWLISAPNGGTLDLTYTGETSYNNVIFTRVVYMTKEQVDAYANALSKTNATQIIQESLVDFVGGTLTAAFVKTLEIQSGLVAGALGGLVGISTGFVISMFRNLEKLNFYDALDRSTTGKLKLEFYYLSSLTAPYYMEFTHFEPWNSNFAEVPENYSRTWHPGEFLYD